MFSIYLNPMVSICINPILYTSIIASAAGSFVSGHDGHGHMDGEHGSMVGGGLNAFSSALSMAGTIETAGTVETSHAGARKIC